MNMVGSNIVDKMAGDHLYKAVRAFRKHDFEKAERRIDDLVTASNALLMPREFNPMESKMTLREVIRLEVKHKW